MKNLFEGSRFGYNKNQVYVQGNYLDYYNSNMDCLEEGPKCPLQFENVHLLEIDEEGLTLLLPKNWEEDDTWCIYERNEQEECFHYIDKDVLLKEG